MPISRITSGPGELVPETDIILSDSDQAAFVFGLAPGQPDQQGVTFQCSLDEGGNNPLDVDPFVPCTSPRAFFGLENGEHKFEVRAINAEGVIEEPAQFYEWTVELGPDEVDPETTILRGPPLETSSGARRLRRGRETRCLWTSTTMRGSSSPAATTA